MLSFRGQDIQLVWASEAIYMCIYIVYIIYILYIYNYIYIICSHITYYILYIILYYNIIYIYIIYIVILVDLRPEPWIRCWFSCTLHEKSSCDGWLLVWHGDPWPAHLRSGMQRLPFWWKSSLFVAWLFDMSFFGGGVHPYPRPIMDWTQKHCSWLV